MKPFKLSTPVTSALASQTHLDGSRDARFISGGTDILGELKEGILQVDNLVSLQGLPDASGIDVTADGLEIGALVTLSQLAGDRSVADTHPALSMAAESVATPQIRNAGTLGGNLCQRPRCWYYRSPLFNCLKKGGDSCFARDAGNKYHAILSAEGCHIVHPSDLAVALLALEATVEVTGAEDAFDVPVSDFYVPPDVDMLSENILKPGQFVSRVRVPNPRPGSQSLYLKAKERQAYDFALSSVALCVAVRDGTVSHARTALGGVAPVPYPVPEVDAALQGSRVQDVDAQAIGQLAVNDAKPLSDNGFKVGLTASLVARAVHQLMGG